MKLLINLVLNSLAVYITSLIVPGIFLTDFSTALFVALVLGLLNLLVKPILILLTLPINIISFGLFTLIINAIIILMTSYLVAGFRVTSLISALVFALLLSVINTLLHNLSHPLSG